jgi:CRISPR-associated protein Cmr4
LLFPIATRDGPLWVTCPTALRVVDALRTFPDVTEDAIHRQQASQQPLNLGWLMLPVKAKPDGWPDVSGEIKKLCVPDFVRERVGVVSDKLFGHVVNSNLEVRTSVSIDPTTGAAEEGALFTYEALPRGTLLVWEVTCRNPGHYKVGKDEVGAVKNSDDVHAVVAAAHSYLEHLGLGGMGTRGMGRLRVLSASTKAGEKE